MLEAERLFVKSNSLHVCKSIYETRSRVMSIKSRSLNSAIRPQSCSRGVLCVIIEFGVFKFLNSFISLEYNSVDNLC